MTIELPESLTIESDGPIRIVTMNRPDVRNAVDGELHTALAGVWRTLRADREARVVILTGAGDAFCAGGDLIWIESLQEEEQREFVMNEVTEILFEMARFPLPVIGAVNGPAVGLGCSLAIMTDIALISDAAYMADPHVSVGLVAGDGGAAMWPLLTSALRTREYLFTGDPISPTIAVELGLASRVVPSADLMTEARSLAERLARQPKYALQDTKRTINLHFCTALAGIVQTGVAAEKATLTGPDHIKRLKRFREKSQ